MHLTHWDILLWILGDLGYLTLAAVLIAKKRYRKFPWFSALLASEIIQTILLMTVCAPHYQWRYFYCYWAGEVVNAILLIAVIFEVARLFSRTLSMPESAIVRDVRMIGWTIPAIVAFAVLFLKILPDLHHELANLAFKIDTICAVLMISLVGTVSMSMYFYGLRARVHAAAITYGMLVYSIGRVLVFAAVLNTADSHLWIELERCLKPVYIVALFVWSAVLWRDEPERKLSGEMQRFVEIMNRIPAASVGD
jgi:hypothetical protein